MPDFGATMGRGRTRSGGGAWPDAGPRGQRMTPIARFGANPGGLGLYAYAPQGLAPGSPLVVALHGCTQDARAYAADAGWLQLADRCGFAVIAPEQTAANNPNRCFNWFLPEDTARGQGEAASIAAMVSHVLAAYRLNPRRVFVTGLSAGGAMAAAMLATYPDLFRGGGIVAGLPYGVARNVQEAMGRMHGGSTHGGPMQGAAGDRLGDLVRRAAPGGHPAPRISIWHGDADHVVNRSNAVDAARQWASVHGLGEAPDETEVFAGRTRAIWRACPKGGLGGTGEVVIESHLVRGLGHGTPLSTRGAGAVGATAPFMLEAGVSSTVEMARFWGLVDAAAMTDAPKATPGPPAAKPRVRPEAAWTPDADKAAPEPPAPEPATRAGVGDQVMGAIAPHVPKGIQDTIAKALRAAGLMS